MNRRNFLKRVAIAGPAIAIATNAPKSASVAQPVLYATDGSRWSEADIRQVSEMASMALSNIAVSEACGMYFMGCLAFPDTLAISNVGRSEMPHALAIAKWCKENQDVDLRVIVAPGLSEPYGWFVYSHTITGERPVGSTWKN